MKTCNCRTIHPIGSITIQSVVISWPDPTDPDAGNIRSVGWCLEVFSWLFFVVLRCMRCSFFMARLYSLELDISLINLRRNLVFIKSFCACAVSFIFDLPNSSNVHDHFISSSFHLFSLSLAIFACINTFPWLSNNYIQIWPNSIHKTNNNATKNMLTLSVIKSPTLEFCSPSSKS